METVLADGVAHVSEPPTAELSRDQAIKVQLAAIVLSRFGIALPWDSVDP